jgi:hypothetical protein
VELGGMAIATLLGMLICPVLLVLAAVGRVLPWHHWAKKLRHADAWRVS